MSAHAKPRSRLGCKASRGGLSAACACRVFAPGGRARGRSNAGVLDQGAWRHPRAGDDRSTGGHRFKIEIENEGTDPIEFESTELHVEKVLAGGAKSYVVINGLKPGTYIFFDDFHPDTGKVHVVVK